ncbi:gamma-glutamylcyclotransferase [Psychroserpens burtonensis]|uniref:Gamma-glutamylcyclotransferase n=1 Tax=Psychroserpens burtonensis TaxID=49278 RepID=A0A5C7BGT8_9FLAO|nr:gamma-glutamylcyclotransferase family protein [Psychroserpens burtonensis]TXE18775.1 gamma-glutamylcyclotransferase [Psychroserpens burtonensis]
MKSIQSIIIILLTVLLFSCNKTQNNTTITIEDGKIGIIGYESLMSKTSIERTLKRTYQDSVYHVYLKDYNREWNWHTSMKNSSAEWFCLRGNDTLPFNNIRALNIMAAENKKINCMLFFVTPEELVQLDKREFGYERIDVTDKVEELSFKGGSVFVYKAKQDHTYDYQEENTSVLHQSYIDLVTNACDSIGKEFRDEFEASTLPYNKEVVVSSLIHKNKE